MRVSLLSLCFALRTLREFSLCALRFLYFFNRRVGKREFHPQASHRTVRDSLPSYGSCHHLIALTSSDASTSFYEVVRCLYYGIGIEKNKKLSELIYNKVFKLTKPKSKTKEFKKPRKAVYA